MASSADDLSGGSSSGLPPPRSAAEMDDALADSAENVNDGAAKCCAWCDKEPSGEEGVRFNKCSSCLAVRYCSSACQRAHWKSSKGRHPRHKDICVKVADKRKVAREILNDLLVNKNLDALDDPRLKFDSGVYSAACEEGNEGSPAAVVGGLHRELQTKMDDLAAAVPGSDACMDAAVFVTSALQCLFNASRLRQRPAVSAADEARVRRFLRHDRRGVWPAWLSANAAACRCLFRGPRHVGPAMAGMCRSMLAMTAFALTHDRLAAFAIDEHCASSWGSFAAALGHCNAFGAHFEKAAAAVENGGSVRNYALQQAAVFFQQAAALKGEAWAVAHLSEAELLGVPEALVADLRDPARQGQLFVPRGEAEQAAYTGFLEWRLQSRAGALASVARRGAYADEDVRRIRGELMDAEPPRVMSMLRPQALGRGAAPTPAAGAAGGGSARGSSGGGAHHGGSSNPEAGGGEEGEKNGKKGEGNKKKTKKKKGKPKK